MIDSAMLRPGRLDKPLFIDLPAMEERLEILKILTKKTPLADVNPRNVAEDDRCSNFRLVSPPYPRWPRSRFTVWLTRP
jgi:ribosome biogenesis ATPase